MSTAYAHFYGPEADRTCNGACTNCGTCCVDTLPLTPLDIRRIKDYVHEHQIEPIAHTPNPNWDPPRDDVCPFYQPYVFDGRHCMIYPVRPIICKHYLCRGYADPAIRTKTARDMLNEARQQAAVRKNLAIFLQPRSLRYAIWPERFPEYEHIQLIFQPNFAP